MSESKYCPIHGKLEETTSIPHYSRFVRDQCYRLGETGNFCTQPLSDYPHKVTVELDFSCCTLKMVHCNRDGEISVSHASSCTANPLKFKEFV